MPGVACLLPGASWSVSLFDVCVTLCERENREGGETGGRQRGREGGREGGGERERENERERERVYAVRLCVRDAPEDVRGCTLRHANQPHSLAA